MNCKEHDATYMLASKHNHNGLHRTDAHTLSYICGAKDNLNYLT